MKKILAIFLVVATLLACMVGCAKKEEPVEEQEKPATEEKKEEKKETKEKKEEKEPEVVIDETTYNRLTGEYTLEPGTENNRPIAIMINNIPIARPQYGIVEADLFFECETEGGITRIMAIYANADVMPEQIGSVRSARTPFVKIAYALDFIYTHAGGSPMGLQMISDTGIDHINALAYDGSYFWRDAEYRASKGLEHSMMTSGENIAAAIANQGERDTTDRDLPYTFAEADVKGSDTAKEVQIYMSGYQTINFTYNEEDGQYYKGNGSLENSSDAVDYYGNQIYAKNVIVMYDERQGEGTDRITFVLDQGSGLYLVNGTVQEITWSRNNEGMYFYDSTGKVLQVNTGKTYVCLLSDYYVDDTIIR